METKIESIEIRINGIEATGLRLQQQWIDGYPSNSWTALVEIPNLGYIELDEKPDFIIEVKDPREPAVQQSWRRVTLSELLQWLASFGILPNE
jgi:hypothetical protein